MGGRGGIERQTGMLYYERVKKQHGFVIESREEEKRKSMKRS